MVELTKKDVFKALAKGAVIAIPVGATGIVLGHPEVILPAIGLGGTVATAEEINMIRKQLEKESMNKKKKLKKVC